MFEYPKFDVTVSRNIDTRLMCWPASEEVCHENSPGGNLEYRDLMRIRIQSCHFFA